jgi:hypothetical protein
MRLTANIGSADRILRTIVGIVLIALALRGVFTPWAWIGIVPLVTAFVKICPLYSIVGLKTCHDC